VLNKKKYLNKIITSLDLIKYDKAYLFNNIYRKNQERLSTKFLPQGWHWIFFNDTILSSHLAEDGHPVRGKFFPKLGGYKRMFASSTIKFHKNFQYNTLVKKTSQVIDIKSFEKTKTKLHFIEIRNIYSIKNRHLLEERQKIAFIKNDFISKGNRSFNLENLIFLCGKKYKLNNIILFRYSALTYNSHRIHYDIDYVRKHEKYKNLLVQGPLLANIIIDNIKKKFKNNLKEFNFKIYKPIFVNEEFTIKFYENKLNKKKIHIFILKNKEAYVALTAEGFFSN